MNSVQKFSPSLSNLKSWQGENVIRGTDHQDFGWVMSYQIAIIPRPWLVASICVLMVLGSFMPARAEPITVRYKEGVTRGFLVVSTPDGKQIGDGDVFQIARGDEVTSRMLFHFKDGSIDDETTVFSQNGSFKLLSDHVLQKGPIFKQPIETSIDTATKKVTVRYTDKDGKANVLTQELDLSADLANGLLLTLLKNVNPKAAETRMSYLAATPKPRLVTLVITRDGEQRFIAGTARHAADRYNIKVDIGGVAGVVAHVVGKQPPDTKIWMSTGEAPSFVELVGPFFGGEDVWRISLASPKLSKNPEKNKP